MTFDLEKARDAAKFDDRMALENIAHSAIGQIAWSISIETGRMPDEMCIDFLEWQVPPEIKKTWTDWAAKQLRGMQEAGQE